MVKHLIPDATPDGSGGRALGRECFSGHLGSAGRLECSSKCTICLQGIACPGHSVTWVYTTHLPSQQALLVGGHALNVPQVPLTLRVSVESPGGLRATLRLT